MEGSTQFLNPMYGVCYSFNYVGHEEQTKKGRQVSLPGPFYGLTMELNIEAEQYLRRLNGWVMGSLVRCDCFLTSILKDTSCLIIMTWESYIRLLHSFTTAQEGAIWKCRGGRNRAWYPQPAHSDNRGYQCETQHRGKHQPWPDQHHKSGASIHNKLHKYLGQN